MSRAGDYNAAQLAAGNLTPEHVTELVRAWQASHNLVVDGMAGPQTIASIAATGKPAPFLGLPLPILADGRRPTITQGFNPTGSRPHFGCDWFYPWRPGDKPDFVGDHGAAGKPGAPQWVVPTGVAAVAAAAGQIQFASSTATGFTVWVDHGNGYRSGYFHLLDLHVRSGDRVAAGDSLGLVGDNPADHDGRHLHFEVCPVGAYSPHDPELFLTMQSTAAIAHP